MILRDDCLTCQKKVEIKSEVFIPSLSRYLYSLSCGHVRLSPESLAERAKENFSSLNGEKQAWKYQEEGVRFIRETNYNVLVADGMGLGKTIQVALAIRENYENLSPILIIVPSPTVYQWANELNQWTNDKDLAFQITDSKSLIPPGFAVYIITRDLMAKPKVVDKLIALKLKTVIVDEVHGFKDRNAKRTVGLMTLIKEGNIEHRILLSGTPIKNRASEYFTALNILMPGKFPSYQRFIREWLIPDERGIPNRIAPWKLERFKELISKFVIRREKAEVLSDLPELQRNFVYRNIDDPTLKSAYNHELDLLTNAMNNGERLNTVSILGYLARLRQMVAIAKVPLVVEYAKEFLEFTDDKIAIGLHHTAVKRMLASALTEYKPLAITGEESAQEKHENVNLFKESIDHRVALINMLAGGQGVDGLQESFSNAIIMERQWNFSDERQFEDRFHRPGQKKPVVIDYVLAAGTIDQYFTEMIEFKRKVFRETVGEDDYVFTNDEGSIRELAKTVCENPLR